MAEKKYIEREAVLRRMQKIATEAWKMRIKANVETVWNEAQDVLRFFPAAGVRPVVLCKDCMYAPSGTDDGEDRGFALEWPHDEWPEDNPCPYKCDDGWYSHKPKPGFFCANGKVKNNG